MSKEQQIEEMAQIIRNRLNLTDKPCVKGECGGSWNIYGVLCWCVYKEIAEMLYDAGYRKQSEGGVARHGR